MKRLILFAAVLGCAALPAMADDAKKAPETVPPAEARHPYMLTDQEAQAIAQALVRPACPNESLLGTLNAQYSALHPVDQPAPIKQPEKK